MRDNHRQRQAKFRQIPWELIHQQKQLLIKCREVVLFTTCHIGSHRGNSGKNKLIKQYTSSPVARFIPHQQNNGEREHTADDLP
ncbi:Uncharacterised protein [Shigella sonnei]|nr:Uncharacterised protein [Shigella sonnei]CSE89992.1 Uncharacterised protein [Shigella sonnei]CSF47694.1 Uncharacterised protein [Shigella sonnei]CSF70181.1 Uncharacterised protein [Shigella sonnei]CSF92007.1 Uncharacterised protein [Shigella sonnei]